jgi:hypothetical protein
MGIVTGGNVIPVGTTTTPGTKQRATKVEAVPTDANVGGGYRTPANAELAINVLNGNIYERQAGAWVRVDTL